MPEIAVATSAAAAASPAPAPAGKSAAVPADGQSADPFATVLQQQMENPVDQATAIKAAAVATAAADPVPTAGDIAALLPMLMGSAMFAGTASAEAVSPGTKKTASDDANSGGTATPLVLALPTVMAAPVTTSMTTPIATPAENTASIVGTGAANTGSMTAATANLAAAPELAAAGAKQDLKSGESFEALLADNRDVRAAGLPATPIHAAPVAGPASAAGSHNVETAVGGHGWDAEVGNHLVWMSGNQASRAELVLTPPQMGKIEISLTMSGDQATATFVSANPAVREAIESAMPRLREILADAGVTLGQTQVGSEAPKQWANDSENRDNSFRGSAIALGGVELHASATGAASWTVAGRGFVDVFA
jgi:flagellar hook-length control protein FliK